MVHAISLAISLGIWKMGRLTQKGSYYRIELEHIFNFSYFSYYFPPFSAWVLKTQDRGLLCPQNDTVGEGDEGNGARTRKRDGMLQGHRVDSV